MCFFKGLSGVHTVKVPAPTLFMDGQLQALGKGKIWLSQKSFSEPSGSQFEFFPPLTHKDFLPTHLLSENHWGSHVAGD